MAKRKSRRLRPGRLIILITALCVLLGGFISVGYVAYAVSDMPAWNPDALESMVPTTSTIRMEIRHPDRHRKPGANKAR
ncbi:hypothetical protein N752_02130 [Desulforamulus aquiferis]|nr:hypothetical protein [Desulforamulus aquiferis]RYD06821.1 hypothetical protein N752_02130 [Desulforamulus aquiferis]